MAHLCTEGLIQALNQSYIPNISQSLAAFTNRVSTTQVAVTVPSRSTDRHRLAAGPCPDNPYTWANPVVDALVAKYNRKEPCDSRRLAA